MIPKPLHLLNEALAFLLELCAIGALAWWGFHAAGSAAADVLLGLGAPAAAVVLWGLFAAPRARITVPLAGRLLVKAVVFGSSAAALYGLGDRALGLGFAIAAAANTAVAAVDRNAAFRTGR